MPREWNRIRNSLEHVYRQQKRNAVRRGIVFLLSFDEWLEIWEASGFLDMRGRRSNEYCMSRIGDCGAYAIGNVVIKTNGDNHRERAPAQHTEAFKRKTSRRLRGNKYGKGQKLGFRHTEESRLCIGEASKAAWKDPAYRKKMRKRDRLNSKRLQGHEVTPETREKIGAAHIGREHSVSTRTKMSATHRKRQCMIRAALSKMQEE